MKLVLAGFALLVVTISVGVGCGPKEKYCYEEMDTCENVKRGIEADAMFMPEVDGEASSGVCFDNSGKEIPCGG